MGRDPARNELTMGGGKKVSGGKERGGTCGIEGISKLALEERKRYHQGEDGGHGCKLRNLKKKKELATKIKGEKKKKKPECRMSCSERYKQSGGEWRRQVKTNNGEKEGETWGPWILKRNSDRRSIGPKRVAEKKGDSGNIKDKMNRNEKKKEALCVTGFGKYGQNPESRLRFNQIRGQKDTRQRFFKKPAKNRGRTPKTTKPDKGEKGVIVIVKWPIKAGNSGKKKGKEKVRYSLQLSWF